MKKYKVLIIIFIILLIILNIFMFYYKNETNNIKEENIDKKDDIKENTTIENSSLETDSTKENNTNEKEDNTIENDNVEQTFQLKKLGNLQYYLYTPSNPTSNMSLIMYLHGGTNKRLDISSLLTIDGFPKYLYDGYYGDLRSYVVIPKLDNSYVGWVDIYEDLRNLIKYISDNYNTDLNKVSLTGHSMGGTATYQLQVKMPNTFKCIAPLSGSIENNKYNLDMLKKTNIWAFVGSKDTIVDPNSTIDIVNSLKNINATVKLTEYSNADHFDVPSLAYKNMELINWLINCK